MQIIHSFQSNSLSNAMGKTESVTVLVNRRVSSAEEKLFLTTLKSLLEEFDRFPGTLGSMAFRQEVGGEVEFSILQRFSSEADHDVWLNSPGFARWIKEVAPPTPTQDHVHRYSGIESLFVSAQAPNAPPVWKMTVLLIVASYPMTLAVSYWLMPALSGIPMFISTLIMSIFMVAAMTYVIAPFLTKIFQKWLEST